MPVQYRHAAGTLGKMFHQPVLHGLNLCYGDGVCHLRMPLRGRYLFCLGDKLQILQRRHIRIDGRLFGEITDTLFGGRSIFKDIMAVDQDLPFCCRNTPGDHVHGSGFSSAVGP